MRLGYSEFSFGYALTENLIRSTSVVPGAAPDFPNLVQEGQLGYDVRIDRPSHPLYLQFKLPELLTRSTATEIAALALPGIHVNFFRMALMRPGRSSQHQLLLDLEAMAPKAVYYGAPAIESVPDFNMAYRRAEVHKRTMFFSPRDIGPLRDDKQHVVAYRLGLPWAWFRSEPKRIRALDFSGVAKRLSTGFQNQRYHSLAKAVASIRKDLRALHPEEHPRNGTGDSRAASRTREQHFRSLGRPSDELESRRSAPGSARDGTYSTGR